ncbi:hypothetical protein AB0O91_38985 [Kitasatospora sp. NPDC089797]|uniref:hypothetical protein n=1 Tax=Kitasatospora sp. NPDC089797 TaxID=3155298 RepID=UPI00341B21A6
MFHGLPRPVRPGTDVFAEGFDLVPGGAYTLAMAVHRLGRRVVWSADFGTDLFTARVPAGARQEGLDEAAFRHHPFPVRSLTVALSSGDDRAMVSFQDPVEPEPLGPLLHRFRPRLLLLPQRHWDEGTAAGDCFNAGLVHGLPAGWSPADCLAAATRPGSGAPARREARLPARRPPARGEPGVR